MTNLEVEFTVDGLIFGIDHLEGVTTVAVHVAEAVRSSTIPEQEGHLVVGLGPEGDEVPEHVRVLHVSFRVTFLGVDEAWEVHGIPDEEDGSVVANKIPVSVFSVELHCEASWIPSGVC